MSRSTPRPLVAVAPLAFALALGGTAAARADEPAPATAPPGTPSAPATPDPAEPTPAPPATPPAPAPSAAAKGARVDETEAAYRACNTLVEQKKSDEAHACYAKVVAEHPGTEAALEASAALFILDAHLTPPAAQGIIPAGRLGITTAAGLFGAWNAVAAAIVVENTSQGSVPAEPLFLGTGVGAIVLGVAGGAGGYFLADALQLDEGAARLVGSSLVWGTALGTAIAPSVAAAISGTNPTAGSNVAALNAAVATVVLSGYVFGGGSLLLASGVSFDEAQVGLINSGGILGSALGLLILPDLAALQVDSVYAYSAAYVVATAAGLVGGGALGRVLDLTWGEVLVCDLGGVLGLVGGGAVGLAVATAASNDSSVYIATGVAGAGIVAGYGAGLALVTAWRTSRGAPILRSAPSLRPTALTLVDAHGAVVPGIGVAGDLY